MKQKKLFLIGGMTIAATLAGFNSIHFLQKAPTAQPVIACISSSGKEFLRSLDTTKQVAPLLDGLGDYTIQVSTKSADALKFFNQGLNLYYAFNHLEAYRSFVEASRLDKEFAMAYWGQALSLGPNINSAMDPADAAKVYDAVEKAQSLSGKVSPKEKVLIEAVGQRYTSEAPEDRSPLDKAYAEAMKSAADQFPTDPDILSLYAESLMDLHPWDYWQKDGTPQPWTPEILSTIEKAISISPKHPGANHIYIHACEASATPGKATASADLLRDLMPGAGHITHMPSHIYIRTGRYLDGVTANNKAIASDEAYIEKCKAEGLYPLAYYPHNIHFLWACATLDGQSKVAIQAADRLAAKQNMELMLQSAWSTLQHYYVTPFYARVRFGKWDDILRFEKPDDRLKYANGILRYARAIALIRKQKFDLAKAELQELQKIAHDETMKNEKIWGINSMQAVLLIAEKVVMGELAAAQKNYIKAIDELKSAIKLEDELLYQEPYDWHHPVRQVLGAVLLGANQPAEAEKYFREDLKMFAGNGWSLTGLKKSLEMQGKAKDAKNLEVELKQSFARADIKLSTSMF